MSAYLVDIFARIDALGLPAGSSVAHLGGGMGLLPKMLMGRGFEQEVFEIDDAIAKWLLEGVPGTHSTIHVGDWRETLVGSYEIIVYDIDAPVDMDSLRKHLNPDGHIFTLTQQEKMPL